MERDIQAIFEHWRTVMQHERARLDDKRRRLIRARLRDGYSREDLELAVEGCAWSPFHQGDNERNTVYDSVELIFRSADRVDGFMTLGQKARAAFLRRQQQPQEAPQEKRESWPVEQVAGYLEIMKKMLTRKRETAK